MALNITHQDEEVKCIHMKGITLACNHEDNNGDNVSPIFYTIRYLQDLIPHFKKYQCVILFTQVLLHYVSTIKAIYLSGFIKILFHVYLGS